MRSEGRSLLRSGDVVKDLSREMREKGPQPDLVDHCTSQETGVGAGEGCNGFFNREAARRAVIILETIPEIRRFRFCTRWTQSAAFLFRRP